MIVDYDTATWNSLEFRRFSPEAKLILIYLFTNDAKSITGIYKIDFDKISFETGIKSQKIAKIIEELKSEVMYDYDKGIVWIIAHTRKQFCRTPNISPKIIKSIENNLTTLRGHSFVGLFLNEYNHLNLFSASSYTYPIQTLTREYLYSPSGGEGKGGGEGIIKKDGGQYPSLEEIRAYCLERKNDIDPQYFIDYQEARDWKLKGGQKVKDWKAVIRTWEKNNFNDDKKINTARVDYFEPVNCKKCGKRILLKADLTKAGCVYCPEEK